MRSDAMYIFDFIVRQLSFTPEGFKDAIVNAALAKFTLSAIWWGTRLLVSKFPPLDFLIPFSRSGEIAVVRRSSSPSFT